MRIDGGGAWLSGGVIGKLTGAEGEQMETQHWLIAAFHCDDLSEPELNALTDRCDEVGRMIHSRIQKADSFASGDYLLREDEIPYLEA